MAWTTPTVRATGDLITAAIWNADVVNNLKWLKQQGGFTVRGEVTSGGAVAQGSGFTSVKNSTGNYTVTFSTNFGSIPLVVASVASAAAGNVCAPGIASVSAVTVITYAPDTRAVADNAFQFIAIEQS